MIFITDNYCEEMSKETFEATQKRESQQKLAKEIAEKILEEHPDIYIDYVIDSLKSETLSSTRAAEKLGISPRAFLRLRKKYNIEPISIVKNHKNSRQFAHYLHKKSIKNYYNKYQLKRIPEFEIELAQTRAARSLKIPNKVVWKARGCHSNGKLKARTDALEKFGIRVRYDHNANEYHVYQKTGETLMTKQEVDKLNLQYLKLKVFL